MVVVSHESGIAAVEATHASGEPQVE